VPSTAALINGAASHALDYDDVNFAMGGHPTVTIVPALLALGEQIKASGQKLVESFVVGYETAGRVGLLVAPSHYQKGFHGTGTIGAFAAAAAAGHMLGLDASQIAVAFGIAGTQAAGLKSNFGTMCKPLHAGLAAAHGLGAARLAAAGFTARADILECDQGFAQTQSDQFNAEVALAPPASGWHLRNNLFKYHAACFLTHAPIEAARQIMRTTMQTTRPSPDRIARLVLRIDAGADKICNIAVPTNGLEAKFSLRQTVAMAVLGVDTAALASYNEAITRDPRVVALRDKVTIDLVHNAPSPGQQEVGNWSHSRVELAAHFDDGSVAHAAFDCGIPAQDLTAQRRALEAKYESLVVPVLGAAAARRLHDLIENLPSLSDVGELLHAAAR
jgi:2-methylcitrate dehydratase PrpD